MKKFLTVLLLFWFPQSANAYTMVNTWANVDAVTTHVLAYSTDVDSLLAAENLAAIRAMLDLEAGTDFYSVSAADLAFEPLKGEDDNFVTDAEKIVIGNTSGTNTGDQSASDVAITDSDEYLDALNVETAIKEIWEGKETARSVMSQAEAEAGTDTTIKSVSALRIAQAIAAQATNTRSVSVKGSVSTGSVEFSPGWNSITVAGAHTWTFANWPSSGEVGQIIIMATGSRSSAVSGLGDVIWDESVDVDANNFPDTFSTGSGVDFFTLISVDGGTTIMGFIGGEFAE